MGEAKRRKLLDPNYGKGNQVTRRTKVTKTDIVEYIQYNDELYKNDSRYKPDFGLYFYHNFDFTPIVLILEEIYGLASNSQEGYIPFQANFMDGIERLGTVIIPKRDLPKVGRLIANCESLIIFPDPDDISRDNNSAYYLPFKPNFAISDIQEYRVENNIKNNFYIQI